MTKTEIINALETKDLSNDDLRDIAEWLSGYRKERRTLAAQKVAAKISRGSKVRIRYDAPLRPRYILGTTATVVKVNRTRARIKLDEVHGGTGRFYTGQEIACPMNALETV